MVTKTNNRMIDGATVNVLDFQAVGDGVTDDTTCIQTALNQTGRVDLAGRVYSVNALTLPDNTHAVNGRLDLRTPNSVLVTMGNRTSLDNVILVGSGNTEENLAERLVQAGAANIGESSPAISDVKITNCELRDTNGFAIRLAYVNGAKITGCVMDNLRYAGVVGVGVRNVQVNGNRINDITGLKNDNAYGISFTTDSTISTGAGGSISDQCTANDNIITNVLTWNALDTHGGRNITFSGNSIKTCRFGIGIVNAPKPSSVIVSARYVSCSGNTIDNTAAAGMGPSFGITVSGEVGYPCLNVAVTGNTLMRCGEPENSISGAIQIKDTQNCVISGNSLHQPKVMGINLYLNNEGVTVTGNVVVDPYDDVITIPTGIVIRSTGNSGIIDGNTLYATGNNIGTYTAVRGIDVSTSIDNDVVFGTNFSNYAVPIRGINAINPDLVVNELVDNSTGTPNDTVSPVGDTTVNQSAVINNNFADLTAKVNQLLRIAEANGWAI